MNVFIFSFLDFYIFSVDTVSLLTIVACALRLPIYASCQPSLRAEMVYFAKSFCKRQRRSVNDEHNDASSLTDHNGTTVMKYRSMNRNERYDIHKCLLLN